MSIFGAIIGFIVCAAAAGLFFRAARRKKRKKFVLFGVLFCLAAIIFAGYLALAAIFLTGSAFDENDGGGIPGQDWRTRRGYMSAGTINEGPNPIGLLYFLYDNNQLAFYLNSESRTSVLTVDLSTADDPASGIKDMKLEDLNFDGYKDIRIPVSRAEGNTVYKCYLWDKEHTVFKYNPELSALPNIAVDAGAKIIKSLPGANSEKTAAKNYRWQNGELSAVTP